MEISGIIFIEEGNMNHIHLYKEGSFWKAYEHSAYLFVQHIKAYQPNLRYYKNIDREVLSIGFPDIALTQLIEALDVVRRDDIEIDIVLEESVDTRSFSEWKEHTLMNVVQQKMKREKPADKPQNVWLAALRSFPVADKTPIECMKFITDLQQQI